MSESWRQLSEEDQERLLRRTWDHAIDWAQAHNLNRAAVTVLLGDRATTEWLAAARSRLHSDEDEFVGESVSFVLREAFPKPVEISAYAGSTLLLRVYGSWDGILAYSCSLPDISTAD